MPPTVNARIPLSLLEAVRRMDTPETDTETEYVQELRNKRLGLSDTVYQQIRRYSDAVKRGQGIWYDEATGLATLIGRRPDAEDLYDSAGKILANDVYQAISPARRNTIRILPALIGRPLALRELKQIAARYFRGTLTRTGSFLSLSITDSVTASSSQHSLGCTYYASALGELLRLLIHGGGSVDHVLCLQRGDTSCEWRAESRNLQSEAT
jgi:hypothetical protein